LRAAEAALKEEAKSFHGSLWACHHDEEDRVKNIIANDVRRAARWADNDGSGIVLAHVLRFSAPMMELNRLFPQPLPQAYEQNPPDWWAQLAAELISKYSRLMEFKEARL
jgi:hypothetical protein